MYTNRHTHMLLGSMVVVMKDSTLPCHDVGTPPSLRGWNVRAALCSLGVILRIIEIMEKKMETPIMGYIGFRV